MKKQIEMDGAARKRVMRKIEARRNRSNREVSLDAMEYVLKTSKLCSSAITAARLVAENTVETLKERGLGDDDVDLRLAQTMLKIATEIDRAFCNCLHSFAKADSDSRLA